MSTSILYTHNEFIRAIVAECLINYFKLDVKIVEITEDVENFLNNFPLRAIPGLITSDGTKYHEQIAVNNYLIHSSGNEKEIVQLLGKSENYKEQSAILQIASFATSDLLATLGVCGLKDIKGVPISDKQANQANKNLEVMIKLLEDRLTQTKYLIRNDSITIADLMAAASLSFGFITIFDSQWRKEHSLITEWFDKVVGSKYMEYRFKDFKHVESAIKVSATPLPWDPKH